MTHTQTRKERMYRILEMVKTEREISFNMLVAKISIETGASEAKVQEYVRVLVQAGYIKNQNGLITSITRESTVDNSA